MKNGKRIIWTDELKNEWAIYFVNNSKNGESITMLYDKFKESKLKEQVVEQPISIFNDNTHSHEVFSIKNGEAFLGYKLKDSNCFHFVQIPYTAPPYNSMEGISSTNDLMSWTNKPMMKVNDAHTEKLNSEKESDYEILSFKNIHHNSIINIKDGRGGTYNHYNVNNYLYDETNSVKSGDYIIHSVLRNKDNIIFQLGDNITSNEWSNSYKDATIVRFDKSDVYNGIRVESSNGCNNDLYCINKISKPEPSLDSKPLFTTEDGVDIYEGNECLVINLLNWKYNRFNAYKFLLFPNDNIVTSEFGKDAKYFSTEEKAKEYILLNKPCLSFGEVKAWFNLPYPERVDKLSRLLELVKIKSSTTKQ